MKKLLIGLLFVTFCSCNTKHFKYHISCPNSEYYTDTLEKNGADWVYYNSNGTLVQVSRIGGIGCEIDTLKFKNK